MLCVVFGCPSCNIDHVPLLCPVAAAASPALVVAKTLWKSTCMCLLCLCCSSACVGHLDTGVLSGTCTTHWLPSLCLSLLNYQQMSVLILLLMPSWVHLHFLAQCFIPVLVRCDASSVEAWQDVSWLISCVGGCLFGGCWVLPEPLVWPWKPDAYKHPSWEVVVVAFVNEDLEGEEFKLHHLIILGMLSCFPGSYVVLAFLPLQ